MHVANDTFNYLAVLFSIIVGLAATELLQGLRDLLVARQRVVLYWPAVTRVATLLLILAQTWWAIFGLRGHLDWTFGMYAVVLLQIVLLYLVTSLALPSVLPEGEIDMRALYFAHASAFYLLLVAAAAASIAKDAVIDGRLPDPGNLLFHAGFIVVALAAAASRRDWVHKGATLVIFASFIAVLSVLCELVSPRWKPVFGISPLKRQSDASLQAPLCGAP